MFDPARERASFDRFTLQFTLHQRADAGAPVGSTAKTDISTVVYAGLVGLDDAISPVLPRCKAWLSTALQSGECLGESIDFYRTGLFQAKALCEWLLAGDASVDAWREAMTHHARALVEPGIYAKRQIATVGLDDQMAYCFLAQEYAQGIKTYEHYRPGKALTLKGMFKPRDVAYVLCQQRVCSPWTDQAVLDHGRRMLRSYLDREWLDRGQSSRAATWLMAVHWCADRSLTPQQTLLRAYDDMPDVVRPAFAV